MLLEFRNCTVSVGTTAVFTVAGYSGATVEVEDPTKGGTTAPAICLSAPGIFKAHAVAGGGGHFTGGSILMWTVSEPYHEPGIHTADTSRAKADTTIFTADAT
jgi:hypothetical protein